MKIVDARKGKIVTPTGFRWYDFCLNPYVGCGHGCKYCYVQFLVKDPTHAWGDFIRVRSHLAKQLAKELPAVRGSRVCIGTATDPYQPAEEEQELTCTALELLADSGATKVGIYTKSGRVLRDKDVLLKCKNPNLHMTISPIPEELRKIVEPGCEWTNDARFQVIREFKKAGIKVRLNVAPLIPSWSDSLMLPLIEKIVEAKVDQFYVDPMQPYKQALASMDQLGMGDIWAAARMIMASKDAYILHKARLRQSWMDAWRRLGNPNIIAIWSDHENKVSEDMYTGKTIDPKEEIQ
jgi:DNA repair photolyase